MAEKLRLVEEDQAHGRVREIYGDIKRTMNVSTVGDVFRAFAAYPPLLEVVWWEIKPLVGTAAFDGLADRLRAHALASARQHCYVSDHTGALEGGGLAKAEIDRIRDVVEIFHQNDPRLLVVATLVQQSLATGPVGRGQLRGGSRQFAAKGKGVPPRFNVVAPEQLGNAERYVLEEVRETLDAGYIPSDFRAVARWPGYLLMAWNDIRGQVRSAEFFRHVQEIDAIATAGVHELPALIRLDVTSLLAAGISRDQLVGVEQVVDGMRRVMPGLVATVALLRLGLNSVLEHGLLELEAGA